MRHALYILQCMTCKKAGLFIAGAGMLFAVLPIVGALSAGLMGSVPGCPVDEGSVHTCVVFGLDIGNVLYTLGVMGWFALITMPIGIATAAVGTLIAFVCAWFKK